MPKTITAMTLVIASLYVTSAHALSTGPLDGSTGLQWAYASSLDEGLSLGYRAASIDDLKTLLTDGQFYFNSPNTAQLQVSVGGYNNLPMPPGNSLGGSTVSFADASYWNYPQGLPLGFQISAGSQGPLSLYGGFHYTLGRLDGAGDSVAVLTRQVSTGASYCYSDCPNGVYRNPDGSGTVSWLTDSYSAKWGSSTLLGDVQTNLNESARLYGQVANQIDMSKLGFFVVKATDVGVPAVPEPATGLSLALGLLGLAAVRTRRAR